MAADDSFSWLGHLQHARPGDLRALEAVVNGKAKNEWKTVCETAFHLRKRPVNSLITRRAEFVCIFVTGRRRFLPRLGAGRPEIGVWIGGSIVVGPLGFRASALFSDTFYAVANLRAVIERHAALNASLVVIDEETRWDEVAQFLLLAIELDGRCDCVGGARTDFSLIINFRTVSAQIGLGGKHAQLCQRCGIKMIAVIGKVRHPAEPETAIFS